MITPTPNSVLEMLRKLPPREGERVHLKDEANWGVITEGMLRVTESPRGTAFGALREAEGILRPRRQRHAPLEAQRAERTQPAHAGAGREGRGLGTQSH